MPTDFVQVDAFTNRPLYGNPAAVVFAGHPTVAAAYAVLARYPDKAGASLLRQECGIGIVPVEVVPSESGTLLRMTQGAPS